jgi:ribosomal protein S18 acetylase RimI-like enzyme
MKIKLSSIANGGDIEDSEGAWESFRIERDGEFVGSVTVKTWDDGSSLIERLDVDDTFRCQGIGSAVIRMISADHDSCYIVPDNKRAQALYERLGCDVSDDDLWGALDHGFGVYRV